MLLPSVLTVASHFSQKTLCPAANFPLLIPSCLSDLRLIFFNLKYIYISYLSSTITRLIVILPWFSSENLFLFDIFYIYEFVVYLFPLEWKFHETWDHVFHTTLVCKSALHIANVQCYVCTFHMYLLYMLWLAYKTFFIKEKLLILIETK